MISHEPISQLCAGFLQQGLQLHSVQSMLLISKYIWLLGCLSAPIYSRAVMHFGAANPPALVGMLAPIALCQFGRRLGEEAEPKPFLTRRMWTVSMT
mmetsp:Transcript_4686/g.17689  ORF Transcript_4686/g.17689 Transcript_4686/m.17689 type:complete len:97 (-) Transcript_4686:137-427(-)|eukprot:CAMPEP_0204174618 /NCGR_PEP_ID=MMETSP0361-20130328/46039_1 /ASSEMBLY_ACC=CAM_ASM_000343 /TAXON_ID=268821 /ORGANISM="Scrippsiella Hangoei, Strain SHTV-5" /LENGTH=96 /DNA_ID=CAMNT_0051133121 /DNA_START=305 /DNA_END=595 /DNA_ORIENTATION=-